MQVPFIDACDEQGIVPQTDRQLAVIGGTATHVADKRAREIPQSGLSHTSTIRKGLPHAFQGFEGLKTAGQGSDQVSGDS